MDQIADFMFKGGLVFFQPNENFWEFLNKLPWRHKQFHDIGAGMGCLTRQMRDKGFDVKAYDLYPKEQACVPDIKILDATTDWIEIERLDCMIIARPCHNGFASVVFERYLCNGDALYISRPENVPIDIGDFHFEIVAYNVGAEGENVYRLWAHNSEEALTFHLLDNFGVQTWWQYDEKRNYYYNSAGGGSPKRVTDKVIKTQIAQNWDMFYDDPATCDETSDTGWLAPDGTFYGCDSSGHSYTASSIIGTSEKRLDALGWAKLRGGYRGALWYTMGEVPGTLAGDWTTHKPTPQQVKVLRAKGYKIDRYDLQPSDPDFEVASTLVPPGNSPISDEDE
jgi:hypothetical protein